MAGRAERMAQALTAAFAPRALAIEDESARHAGHAARNGLEANAETHFFVRMVSDAFAGQSRLARQRAVNAALAAEFSSGLHALSLELKAAGEEV